MLYVGLLRAINVGGKNKVEMAKLRLFLSDLGFKQVTTIGNTGNILFKTDSVIHDEVLTAQLSAEFGFELCIVTLLFTEFIKLKEQLPHTWNQDLSWRHNVLFLMDNLRVVDIIHGDSDAIKETDTVSVIENTLFWSSLIDKKVKYSQSYYTKLLSKEAINSLTIRNGNTFEKIYQKGLLLI